MRPYYRYIPVEREVHDNMNPDRERRLFDRILRYTGVFGSVQGVTMLVTLVINMVKSRLLGPVGYGITENLNRSADLVKSSTNLGIATLAVPEISRHVNDPEADELADKVKLTRSWALLTALLGMAVCLILAPLLSRWAFDGDSGYTVSFMVLSLAVAAAAVTGGETAVMKGAGMLRQIALSQLFTGLLSLIISVPLYWLFRFDGIVPALALTGIGSMVVTCSYSFRRFGYRVCPFSWGYLRKGTGMIGFGIFFTATAFFSAWAWSFIAKFLTSEGGGELTGTYSAGYMLVTYLTTLLLAVTDSEYYPRLSAAGTDLNEAHRLMDNQAMAMCMLAAPVVILFMLCMPVVVFVVLDYDKFRDSVLLAQMAVTGLYFKSVSQPVAYLVLARSDSRIYLLQETACYLLLVACVMAGYRWDGIMGLGLAFAVWELLYLLLSLLISRLRYGYRMSPGLFRIVLEQGVLVALGAFCVSKTGLIWLVPGAAACVVSVVLSVRFFSRRTTFFGALSRKTTRK